MRCNPPKAVSNLRNRFRARRVSGASWPGSRQRRDEVGLPGFAAVIGEGLFEAVRIGSDVGPDDAHQDGSAMVRLLIVEFAAAIVEFTDGGLGYRAVLAVRENLAPLMRFGIVEK